jgi:hypothetical protein
MISKVNNTCIILHIYIPEIDSSITLVSLTCGIPPISQNQPDIIFIEYRGSSIPISNIEY